MSSLKKMDVFYRSQKVGTLAETKDRRIAAVPLCILQRIFRHEALRPVPGQERLEQRVHMLTVSAILETSHRIPSLDYHILMKLTSILTQDYSQMIQMFRRMCFHVFAHNRDDHSRNFAYLYDQEEGRWQLSPAYDLTYSNSIGGEHATCVDGNGQNPGRKDLLAVAAQAGIEARQAAGILEEVEETVRDSLSW